MSRANDTDAPPGVLSAKARLALYTARELSPEQKELLAGALRVQARETRALTAVRDDSMGEAA